MRIEQFIVPGVASVMLVFMVVLGATAYFSRDR